MKTLAGVPKPNRRIRPWMPQRLFAAETRIPTSGHLRSKSVLNGKTKSRLLNSLKFRPSGIEIAIDLYRVVCVRTPACDLSAMELPRGGRHEKAGVDTRYAVELARVRIR
jgi:hypothetical protein